jgi:adenine-specific DNA-methyltransferase
MSRIPILIEGEIKTLSPGGQNVLIEKIITEFAPRFTPERCLKVQKFL